MKIFGGITVMDGGMYDSIRSMNCEMSLLNSYSNNIARFGMPGYQRVVPIKTSFAEYIGSHGVDKITDTQPGRMRETGNPLDLIIQEKGYFQVKGKNSVKLTRDGRFQIDKEGFLVSLNDEKVLGTDGEPIKFSKIPDDHKDIKVDEDGTINIYNRSMNKKEYIGQISVASEDGTPVKQVPVRQGYVEDSNVNLSEEFFSIMPIRRNFEANKQAFIIQNENINKLLQNLGRAQ